MNDAGRKTSESVELPDPDKGVAGGSLVFGSATRPQSLLCS
jgi:hypothetical protein